VAQSALRLLLALALGWLLGLMLGRVWLGVALVLASLLFHQWVRLAQLLRWLRRETTAGAPEASGVWGELTTLMVRQLRRKQYHKQRLLRLLRQLRQSTAALPDGVVLLTPRGEILWFNRAAAQLIRLNSPGDLGLRIDNLVRQPEFGSYLRSGRFDLPVVVRASGGNDRRLSLQLVPYGDGELLLLVRDVTDQSRLDALRKDFIANASHELRSPLTVISGYLETLTQDDSLDAGLRAPLLEMQRQARRMNAIVEDLLSLSRLEASDLEVVGEPLDVGGLMSQMRRDVLARPVHPQEVRLSIDSPARLLGDPGQIHSAMQNLIDNAAKYTPPEGRIDVRWWVDAAGGHFAVTDTGIGIAPEHIPRLTERFYRVDAGRSRATGGSGLGLAIVKHALQRHGARLEILSSEGQGSSFICHFPPERVLEDSGSARADAL
jgi:two-component system phosphate regulon sensor histidine kinase PhoR